MKLTISIRFLQYEAIRQLLLGQREINKKKTVLLSGTKSINPELIAVAMLSNRYLFMYDMDGVYKGYGQTRNFTFELHELAALSYFLSDCAGLPDQVDRLNQEIKAMIKPFEYNQKKSPFQIWLEEEFKDYEITFTELRDQHPDTFKQYEERYNSEIKSKSIIDGSVEAP